MNSKNSAILFIVLICFTGIAMGLSACLLLPDMAEHSALIYKNGAEISKYTVYYVWCTAIFFYATLGEAVKICLYIIKDKIFSKKPVKSLGRITIFSLLIMAMYIILLIVLYLIGFFPQTMVLVLCIVIFSCFSIALITQIMKILLIRAIEIKEENDLTI